MKVTPIPPRTRRERVARVAGVASALTAMTAAALSIGWPAPGVSVALGLAVYWVVRGRAPHRDADDG